MMKRTFINICCGAALLATSACANQEDVIEVNKEDFGTIQVGGLFMSDNISTSVTRADDKTNELDPATATDLEWLKEALETGLEINYSNQFNDDGSIKFVDGKTTAKTALLKLTAGLKYTFKYKDTDKDAEWMSNGWHVFEGLYIPKKLQEEVPTDLFNDQSKQDNYNLLSQYTCMPIYPKSKIAATVNQISLPFQHRLSRVIVQVCIADELKKDYNDKSEGAPKASIKDYVSGVGGGTLRFCGVKVLEKVVDNKPIWYDKLTDLKIKPHFLREETSVTIVSKDENGDPIMVDGKEKSTTYTKVPVFDAIVRPTYIDRDAVVSPMPDERSTVKAENDALMALTNKISFTVELDNGMIYTKDVEFDLNPNEQTTIQLVINKEGVNVNDAGTNNWVTDKFRQDDYYGIDNTLGHNLSKAGSCWQRAYQISTDQYSVTDGSNPVGPYGEDGNTQYLTRDQFIKYLSEAKEGGAHHGDYFILTGDLVLSGTEWDPTIDFTGHLDGRHHSITLADDMHFLFKTLNGSYVKKNYSIEGSEEIITANIHTVNGIEYPLPGYRAEILNLYLTNKGASLVEGENTGNIYNCHQIDNENFCGSIGTNGQVTECYTKKSE